MKIIYPLLATCLIIGLASTVNLIDNRGITAVPDITFENIEALAQSEGGPTVKCWYNGMLDCPISRVLYYE